MLRAAIAIAIGLTTVPAYAQLPYAQVVRCVDTAGKVEYRARPCPADAREQVVVAKTSTAEHSAGDTSVGEPSAATPNAGISRRPYISPERKQALDVAERYAAVARAARPQVQVQVLPPAAGK